MKKFKISPDQIYPFSSENSDESVITFPLSGDVPVYDRETGKMNYRDFVIDIDGRLFLIKPRNAAITGDGKNLNILASIPDRSMNYAEMVGWQIRCARQEAGLSCEELAERANIRAKTVYMTESGNVNMKIDLICTLAEALNMEVTLTPME